MPRRFPHIVASLSFLIGGSFATASSADIYRMVDAEGVVTFTNKASRGSKLIARDTRDDAPRRAFMPSDTSPERFTRYDTEIREAATLYQIPEQLIRAVIRVESGFDPRAVSRTNARGLMQLMPGTAQRMLVTDIFEPRQNILGGVRYLRVLANMFNGDLTLTVAAYNAGENAVIRHGGVPPYAETQDYVTRVLAYYRQYRDVRP